MYVTSHDRVRAEIRQYVNTHADVCPTEISIALNLSPPPSDRAAQCDSELILL